MTIKEATSLTSISRKSVSMSGTTYLGCHGVILSADPHYYFLKLSLSNFFDILSLFCLAICTWLLASSLNFSYHNNCTFSDLKIYRTHPKDITNVAFHRSYPLFASCSDDCTAYVFHGMVYSDLNQNPLIVPLEILRGHTSSDGRGQCYVGTCFYISLTKFLFIKIKKNQSCMQYKQLYHLSISRCVWTKIDC